MNDTHYDMKADIFSYGISFNEVLTCSKPYSNKKGSTKGIIKFHDDLKAGVRPEPFLREPQKVMTLISKCWQYDPILRPSSEEITRELKRIRNQR